MFFPLILIYCKKSKKKKKKNYNNLGIRAVVTYFTVDTMIYLKVKMYKNNIFISVILF